jgi:hypothetical protein
MDQLRQKADKLLNELPENIAKPYEFEQYIQWEINQLDYWAQAARHQAALNEPLNEHDNWQKTQHIQNESQTGVPEAAVFPLFVVGCGIVHGLWQCSALAVRFGGLRAVSRGDGPLVAEMNFSVSATVFIRWAFSPARSCADSWILLAGLSKGDSECFSASRRASSGVLLPRFGFFV